MTIIKVHSLDVPPGPPNSPPGINISMKTQNMFTKSSPLSTPFTNLGYIISKFQLSSCNNLGVRMFSCFLRKIQKNPIYIDDKKRSFVHAAKHIGRISTNIDNIRQIQRNLSPWDLLQVAVARPPGWKSMYVCSLSLGMASIKNPSSFYY